MEKEYLVARDPKESDFCYFPFFEIMMTAEGKFKPCSKHAEFITHEGEVVTAENGGMELAWNSDSMKQLRDNFKNDVRSHGCKECWRQQKMGLQEMRYDSYHYAVPESQVDHPDRPMRVEINASNICNLRCRICWPTASHKWIRESKELYGWDEGVHYNMTPENIEAVRQWVPNLMEIGFFGGEPLLAEENIDLLRYCVQSGHSKNIDILLNTNGTVYTDEIVELFGQFKHVFLNFSIDDIGKRFEYQRKGADWEEVVANMKKYIAAGGFDEDSTIECKICCSVTNMNMYYFPEYFEYMNEHFPGMPVYWNLIYDPWEYSVEILPDDVKDIIRDRLKNYVHTTYNMTETGTKTIDDLVTFLNNKVEKDFGKFFVKTEWHDRYRKESFKDVFPEYWEIIKKYKPEQIPDMPRAATVEKETSDEDSPLDHQLEEISEWVNGRLLSQFVMEEDNEVILDKLMNSFQLAVDRFGFDHDAEEEKLNMIHDLYHEDGFDRKRFLADAVDVGAKRLSHMFSQNTLGDLKKQLTDQYMSGFKSHSKLAYEESGS